MSLFAGALSTERGALGFGPRSGPVLGLRYDVGISGPFVLEAELGWFAKSRAVQDTVPADTTLMAVGDADFRAISGLASVRFNITGARTWHGLLPFLLFGGGITTDIANESEADKALPADLRFDFGTSFTGVFGGGIEWYPSAGIGVRLDARNLLWKLTTPRAFLRGDRALVLPSDQWAQNLALGAGLVIRF